MGCRRMDAPVRRVDSFGRDGLSRSSPVVFPTILPPSAMPIIPASAGGFVDTRQITGVIAVIVPIVFNLAFFELGRAFDYPGILRERAGRDPPSLRTPAAPACILRWQALLLSALAMLPLVVLLARRARTPPPALTVAARRRRRGGGPRPGARARALAVRRPGAGPSLRGGAGRPRRRRDAPDRSRSCSRRSTGCSASGSASTSATC